MHTCKEECFNLRCKSINMLNISRFGKIYCSFWQSVFTDRSFWRKERRCIKLALMGRLNGEANHQKTAKIGLTFIILIPSPRREWKNKTLIWQLNKIGTLFIPSPMLVVARPADPLWGGNLLPVRSKKYFNFQFIENSMLGQSSKIIRTALYRAKCLWCQELMGSAGGLFCKSITQD